MSDPWSEDEEADNAAARMPRVPLAHSAPEFGEAEPTTTAVLPGEMPAEQKPWQFSLARLQLLIVILCVCSACLGALIQVNEDEFTMVALLLLILPSSVLILLGIGRGSYELYKASRADRALWYQEPWQANQTPVTSDEDLPKR